jgi:2-polyprenyl-3-methyl-5-hydroxy-6-metoxy-1,4-benzoquinol methylase
MEQPPADEVRASWDANAAFWDERVTAGLSWQRRLVYPSVERLLDVRAGERVLEIACGNGEFARRMADLGAEVLATDFSPNLIERARAHGGPVDYRVVDATDEAGLLELGEGSFDAVVCNMAIMDMLEIEPMASAGARLLRPGGRFVFSTLHPAFNGGGAIRVLEQQDVDGEVMRTYSVKVSRYLTPWSGRGVAIEGQPQSQWYFDRPISMLLGAFFAHGFVLDGVEEPASDAESPGRPEMVYAELPAVLVARMRLPA